MLRLVGADLLTTQSSLASSSMGELPAKNDVMTLCWPFLISFFVFLVIFFWLEVFISLLIRWYFSEDDSSNGFLVVCFAIARKALTVSSYNSVVQPDLCTFFRNASSEQGVDASLLSVWLFISVIFEFMREKERVVFVQWSSFYGWGCAMCLWSLFLNLNLDVERKLMGVVENIKTDLQDSCVSRK